MREKRRKLVLDPKWWDEHGNGKQERCHMCPSSLCTGSEWKKLVWGSEQKLVCLGQSGQGVDPDQVGGLIRPWEGLRFHPKWRESPQRVWRSRVECHFADMDTETKKARWFPWDYRLGRAQQGSVIWMYISVFPSGGRLQSLSLVCGVS